MKFLISLLGVAVGLIGVIGAAVWLFQDRITFQPQGPPFPDDQGVTKVLYKTTDGIDLFAYVVGSPDSGRPLVIVFHGNADLAIRQVEWAGEIVRRTGVAVMIPEYRGYMGIPGRPTYAGSRLDAEAAYHYAVTQLGADPSRLAYFGHSLGTAIAAELALRHEPKALVLQSPFTSANDMAGLMIGKRLSAFLWPVVSRVHYNTIQAVSAIDAPVSVVHGGRDRVIPDYMGRAVYDAAKVKGEWLFVPDGSHSDVYIRGGEEYWRWATVSLAPIK